MKKTLVVLGLVAAMVIGVTYAFAQGPGYGPGSGRMGRGNWGYHKGLSLTQDQRAKFQELRGKFIDETAQLRGAMLTKRIELRSLWTNPKSDSKAILDKSRELRNLGDQLNDKAVQMRLEARNILTPEQLSQIGQGWGMGRGHMMGHEGMMGPGGMMGYGQGEGRHGGQR